MKSSRWMKLFYSRSLSHHGLPPLQPGKTSDEFHADNHSLLISRPPPAVHRCHHLEPAPPPAQLEPSPPGHGLIPAETTSPCLLVPWSWVLSLPLPPHVAKGPSSPPLPLAIVPTCSSSLVPWHSTIGSFKCSVTSLRIFQGGCVRQLILKYNSNPFVT